LRPTACSTETVPPGNLGVIYLYLGDYDKALAATQEMMKVNPGTGLSYGNLASSYLQVNHLDEVRATAQEAQAHNLDSPLIHFNLYAIDFLQRDTAGMEREAAALMGKAGFEGLMLDTESHTAS
jgi:tetratricopeptide (TPR) repeat protein